MKNLFIDVSSHNGILSVDDLNYYKSKGVKGICVKLTEGSEDGTAYVNPLASQVITNAKQVGLVVSVYHFARYTSQEDSRSEARFFVKIANALGLDKNTLLIDDEEHQANINYTDCVNAFIDECKNLGFKRVGVYASVNYFMNYLDNKKLNTSIE